MAELYLAGGCFWGMEKYLASIRGVLSTQAGYANGRTENPSYEEVCHNDTGHAETVRVSYDPEVLPLAFLLELYFEAIDPTSLNRQGGDRGVNTEPAFITRRKGTFPLSKIDNEAAKGLTKPVA
jgi:peptide methionine sulfoxide reductase msrA/msrB